MRTCVERDLTEDPCGLGRPHTVVHPDALQLKITVNIYCVGGRACEAILPRRTEQYAFAQSRASAPNHSALCCLIRVRGAQCAHGCGVVNLDNVKLNSAVNISVR